MVYDLWLKVSGFKGEAYVVVFEFNVKSFHSHNSFFCHIEYRKSAGGLPKFEESKPVPEDLEAFSRRRVRKVAQFIRCR